MAPGGVARADDAKIQTMFASYGYAMNRKDVKDDVVKYCDGKPACSFKVTNENLASHQPLDPSPGDDKGLMIAWKCGDAVQKYQFAEGKDVKISCK
jgi:N-acetyl-anhydromuramyl-L-alanine amidase AmpD